MIFANKYRFVNIYHFFITTILLLKTEKVKTIRKKFKQILAFKFTINCNLDISFLKIYLILKVKFQKYNMKPEKGLLLFWPSDFTHTHRGNPPLKETKYIMTGWVEMH